MEELRSTEILDKEIQEDARKKAGRILRDADAEAAKILAAVDSRVAAIRKEKENAYEQKIAAFKRDAEAALPLEEKRFLVSLSPVYLFNMLLIRNTSSLGSNGLGT